MHDERERPRGNPRDRREIAQRVERRLGVEDRNDDDRAESAEQQGVTVGRCLRHEVDADHAARADAVLDEDLLAEQRRERLAQEAGEKVLAAAGR
jgi:hypothetical protein